MVSKPTDEAEEADEGREAPVSSCLNNMRWNRVFRRIRRAIIHRRTFRRRRRFLFERKRGIVPATPSSSDSRLRPAASSTLSAPTVATSPSSCPANGPSCPATRRSQPTRSAVFRIALQAIGGHRQIRIIYANICTHAYNLVPRGTSEEEEGDGIVLSPAAEGWIKGR